MSNNFPVTESWIFWNEESASNWVEKAIFPIVFKLSAGAGSENVVLIENKNKAASLIKRMFSTGIDFGKIPSTDNVHFKFFSLKNKIRTTGGNILRKLDVIEPYEPEQFWSKERGYVLFQKFLPNNKYDTRITIIGNRALGFRRWTRKNDFRASGSGNIAYDKKMIDLRCIKIAFQISKTLKFQSMAYDFLFNENNEPEICEISYIYADWAIHNCPGFWDDSLTWHEGSHWPQYFCLMDLLNLPELLEP